MALILNSEVRRTLISWSGGKDSCYATFLTLQQGLKPVALLNMMNENGQVSRSHGLPLDILQQQANSMNVPLVAIPSSWNDYEANYIDTLVKLKLQYRLQCAVFGDIDLQPHREWEEKVCAEAHLKAYLPLWNRNRKELLLEMIDAGIESIIVSCNAVMGERFLGCSITKEILGELELLGVDACGENGEYHTVVVNCPLFEKRIELPLFGTHRHNDYCFINWNK